MTPKAKPSKPYPEFPLHARNIGQWGKKTRGKIWCFGGCEELKAALQNRLAQIDDIHAGRDSEKQVAVAPAKGLSVGVLVNLYLDDQHDKVERGQVGGRQLTDVTRTAKRLKDYFGNSVTVAALSA